MRRRGGGGSLFNSACCVHTRPPVPFLVPFFKKYNRAPETDGHQITTDIEAQHTDGVYHGEYDSDGAKQGQGVLLTPGGGR